MSYKKINYEEKVTRNISSEEEQYKVTADNINEIKDVVNNNSDESVTNKYTLTTTEEIEENTDYEIPCNYKVGQDTLDIYYMGEKLIKADPTNNIDGHYIEVGENGTVSNKIQFYNWGQSVPIGRTIEFIVRGVYENET